MSSLKISASSQKFIFPRLILPISATLSGLVDFSIGFIVLLIFVLSYGFRLGWTILFIPFFLVLVILTVLGVGLWLSALNALYRDVRYLIPFLIQFWTLASPRLLFQFYGSGALSLAVWPESDGRCH